MSNFYRRFNHVMQQGKQLSLKEIIELMRDPERIVRTAVTKQYNLGKLIKIRKNGIDYYQIRKDKNNKQITTCPHCGLSINEQALVISTRDTKVDPERIRQHIRNTHR